jgi:transcriptional regulator with XRE-family HTH domain
MSQMHGVTELEWNQLDRLHKSLRVSGHSAVSLATELGVHRNTVNNYLSGKTPLDRRTLIAWAFATGVPLEWLESGAGASPTPPDDGEALRKLTAAKATRRQRPNTRRGNTPEYARLSLAA